MFGSTPPPLERAAENGEGACGTLHLTWFSSSSPHCWEEMRGGELQSDFDWTFINNNLSSCKPSTSPWLFPKKHTLEKDPLNPLFMQA